MNRRVAGAVWRWWPFTLLCIAASCEWMITNAYPQAGSTLTSEACGCALAAAVAFGFAYRRCRGQRVHLSSALAGALVIAGPLVGMFLDASMLSPGSLALALVLVSVVITVSETALRSQPESQPAAYLWPGLAAAAGLLLLLPLPSFTDPWSVAAMLLAPLLTGAGCVLFRSSIKNSDRANSRWHVPVGLAGAALIFALGAIGHAGVSRAIIAPNLTASATDLVLALLSLLALCRLTATQYAARFVIVPFISLLQGMLLLHATLTLRSAGCAVLLIVATGALLRGTPAGKAGPPSIAA